MQAQSLVGLATAVLLLGSGAWGADGAAVFKDQCAKCHGDTGSSDTPVGKALELAPLAGDADLAATPDAEIVVKIKGATKHPTAIKEMPDDALNAVAGHVRELAGGKK